MLHHKIQDPASFRVPPDFSGKPGWNMRLWRLIQATLFSWSFDFMYEWRSFLLRLFGAKIGKNVRVRASARISCPWKVTIEDYCWIGQETILYGPGEIKIGSNTVVSAGSYIDTASHHYDSSTFDIFINKVHIDDEVWIATNVFVAPGVTIGKGAVVGARSNVFNDLPPMMVCVGSPARAVRKRTEQAFKQDALEYEIMPDKIQNLASFCLPPNFRGKPGWYVQLWWIVQACLFGLSPKFMYGWRRWLLRTFGARVGRNVLISSTARVTYPWKVSIGDYTWIGDSVVLYSLGEIEIGSNVVVSPQSYICAASHNYASSTFDIFASKVQIEEQAWLAIDVFVAPGVTIGKGAVVEARSSVFHTLPEMMVSVGSPAKPVRQRLTSSPSNLTV